MLFARRLERTIRSLRNRALEGLLTSRAVRKAAYRRLSQSQSLVLRRYADHDLVIDPGDLVGTTVLETGDFDRRRTEAVCRRATASGRRTVLEIGANIGTQTLYFLKTGLFDQVICLEPDPRNLELLGLNIRLNELSEQARIIPAAAGAASGRLVLRRDAGNSGGATLRADRLPQDIDSDVSVHVVTVDELVREGQIDPNQIGLVWMDAEGFEDEILSASTTLLSRRTPLAFEFTPGFYDDQTRRSILERVFAAYSEVCVIEGEAFGPLDLESALALRRRVDLYCS
ncbi:MAG: FkbM family methyltransferase [Brevundimonas sp.]|nr:MAG: FkbM family methyltransferase [Brevundimonas sp.]